MGKIYSMRCTHCGWSADISLGQGTGDRRYAEQALIALETGPDAAGMQSILLGAPDIEMRLERALYHCRACDRYQVRLAAKLYDPYAQTELSRTYRCEACGQVLTRVRPQVLEHIPCPQCGGTPECEVSGEWELAPAVELREDPLGEPRSIFPLANQCLRATDGEGREVFIPIKTDQQLDRLKRGERFCARTLEGLGEARASEQGYWALIQPGAPMMLMTFPAAMIMVGEKDLKALEGALARSLPGMHAPGDAPEAGRAAAPHGVYMDVEPLNIVCHEGAQGLFGYGLWTMPALEPLADSIRATLQNRNKLNI